MLRAPCAVEVVIDQEPWPLRLVGTAGLRENADQVEQLGIAVSEQYLTAAQAAVVCSESAAGLVEALDRIATLTSAPLMGAWTKADLAATCSTTAQWSVPVVRVSATRGDGIATLFAALTRSIGESRGPLDQEIPAITRARHLFERESAREQLARFRKAWARGSLPAPVASVHVRTALRSLDELVGAMDIDEVFARGSRRSVSK